MKFKIQSITRHLLLICGAAGFMAMTSCQPEEQPLDPPEVEETEEEAEESPDVPMTPPPAPGQPVTPPE